MLFKNKKKYVELKNKNGHLKKYRVYKLSEVLESNKTYKNLDRHSKSSFRNKVIEKSLKYAYHEGIDIDEILEIDC